MPWCPRHWRCRISVKAPSEKVETQVSLEETKVPALLEEVEVSGLGAGAGAAGEGCDASLESIEVQFSLKFKIVL